jgi:MFS family permease
MSARVDHAWQRLARKPVGAKSTNGQCHDTPSPSPHPGNWLPLASILAVTFLGTVSNTIVNVPLGLILDDFGVSLSTGALIVTAWTIGVAALMPIMGWLGDRFGRRRVFLTATAVLILSLFGAALAPSLGVLVLCRGVQGCASAAILPNVMGLIGEIAVDPARGLSGWALANSLGQAVGAPLGGWLSDLLGWRAIFWPLGLVGLVALVIGIRVVPRSAPVPATVFDWRGAALLTSGVGAILSAVALAPSQGLDDPVALALTGIGCLLVVGFVLHARHAVAPLVPLHVVWQRTFVAGSMAAFCQMFCLGATVMAVPYWLTRHEGISTAQAGLITFALPAAMAALAPLSGIITSRLKPIPTIRAGIGILIVAQLALALVTRDPGDTGALLVAVLVLNGIGVAFVQTPSAALASAAVKGVGAGLGIYNMARFSGSLMGAAWVALSIQAHHGYSSLFVGTATVAAVGLAATLLVRWREAVATAPVQAQPDQ